MADLFCFNGTIDKITYHEGHEMNNPYGKEGDVVCICVLLKDNRPDLVALVMESYGTMTLFDSYKIYFKSPFDWCYSNDSTEWKMNQNVFHIQSDSFNPPFTIECGISLIVNPVK